MSIGFDRQGGGRAFSPLQRGMAIIRPYVLCQDPCFAPSFPKGRDQSFTGLWRTFSSGAPPLRTPAAALRSGGTADEADVYVTGVPFPGIVDFGVC